MDDDEEEGGISFVTDAAPPSLAADDSFDAPVVSGATPAADEKPRGKAPKGSNGQQLMWDPVLGTYIEGAYEAEAKELTDQWIQTRYAQTLLNLDKCVKEGGTFGAALITHDEKARCEKLLLAALNGVKNDRIAAKQEETASAVFWAIALVQNAAARRDGGWVVDSEAAARVWDMDTLHDVMVHFKGEVHRTNESGEQSKTTYAPLKGSGGGGRGRGRGRGSGMMDGSNETKRRRLRVDSLGNEEARKQKMRVLHRLILEGGNGLEDGLHQAIINLEPPSVRRLEAPPAALDEAGAAPAGGGGLFAGRSRRQELGANWGKKVAQKTLAKTGVEAVVLSAPAPSLAPLDELDDVLDDEVVVGSASASGATSESQIGLGIVDAIMAVDAKARRRKRKRQSEERADRALDNADQLTAEDRAFVVDDDEDVWEREDGESSGSAEDEDDDDEEEEDEFEEAQTATVPPQTIWVTAVTASSSPAAAAVPVVPVVPVAVVPIAIDATPVVVAAAAQPDEEDDLLDLIG
jgi:hypothetical protein